MYHLKIIQCLIPVFFFLSLFILYLARATSLNERRPNKKKTNTITTAYGFTQFKADVLADNKGMNYIFQHTGIPYTKKSDFGVYTYIFDLQSGNEILYNSPFAAFTSGPN